MPESFQLTVLTPVRTLLDERVESVVAPGAEGYLGVLANHAPLITSLVPGKLTVRLAGGETHIFAISGGFLEVSANRAVILADTMEEPGQIDPDRARRAAERARERLRDIHSKWDEERAEAALARALNRVKVVGEPRE